MYLNFNPVFRKCGLCSPLVCLDFETWSSLGWIKLDKQGEPTLVLYQQSLWHHYDTEWWPLYFQWSLSSSFVGTIAFFRTSCSVPWKRIQVSYWHFQIELPRATEWMSVLYNWTHFANALGALTLLNCLYGNNLMKHLNEILKLPKS